jgi:predicted ferric reductase
MSTRTKVNIGLSLLIFGFYFSKALHVFYNEEAVYYDSLKIVLFLLIVHFLISAFFALALFRWNKIAESAFQRYAGSFLLLASLIAIFEWSHRFIRSEMNLEGKSNASMVMNSCLKSSNRKACETALRNCRLGCLNTLSPVVVDSIMLRLRYSEPPKVKSEKDK